MRKQYAASGSCFNPEKDIIGKVEGNKFISRDFSGSMEDADFWDRLRAFAKTEQKYIRLMY